MISTQRPWFQGLWATARKPILTLVFSALALGAGVAGFQLLASLKQAPAQAAVAPTEYNVEVFAVERCDLPETILGYGTARSDREVVLAAQVAGAIDWAREDLKVGTPVEVPPSVTSEQDPRAEIAHALLKIDPSTYLQRREQAERRLKEDDEEAALLEQQAKNTARHIEKSEADIALYTQELERVEALRKKNIATESQVTTARLELQRYRESLLTLENESHLIVVRKQQLLRQRETHQTELEMARLDVARTVVRPPFSGVISEKFVELGQHVQPGEPLVRITAVSVVEVPLALPLRDYSKIADTLRSGERPTVQLAVNETEAARWTGEVVRVAPRADEQTRTVSVFVRVQNDQQSVPLLPGTFVQGRIAGPMLRDVLVVPRDAIRNDTVVVARKNEAVIVPIEVRERVQNLAVVTGLKPGDLAILTNLDVLRDKSRVKIGARRTLKDELRR